ncbi:MAG: type II secretion system GspH family protein [Planctomycetes bacterium]|nr:type II secretion system GspH family protein [Planctomycetota bacterium]
MQRTRAFTLIELLVVISIVAVLAAMLMPAVSLVRHLAVQTVCASNMRQVHLATTAYIGDNDGFLPPARVDLGGGSEIYWTDLVKPFLESETPDGSSGFAALHDAGSVPKVLTCPALRSPLALTNCYSGIGYNNYGLSTGIWATNNVLVHRIRKPDQLYLFADAVFWYPGGVARGHCCLNDGTDRIHLRHRGRANAFYCDGHLDSVGQRTYAWLQYPIYEWPLPSQ